MATGLSTANLANKLLDHLRNVAYTAPTGLYVQIHTADPGSAGTTAKSASDTGTRKQVTFSAAASGALALTGTQPVWTNAGTGETLTHISVWDASSAGNFLWSTALTSSQPWASGNTFTLTALGISFTPLAA